MNGYSQFAGHYDRLTGNVAYRETAELLTGLLRDNGMPPGGILLDLACGTGTLSLLFAQAGYDVIGVDASQEMLSAALQKPAGEDVPRPLFLCQSMQQLDLYGTVDGAVCSLDSINHLVNEEDVRETFRRVSLFLNPGGVFLFDVNTPYKHRNILNGSTFVYDFEDLYCVWQNECLDDGLLVEISLDFFVREGGRYRRESELFCERAYSDSQLTAWLKELGIEVTARYDGFSLQPPTRSSERLLYVGKKV